MDHTADRIALARFLARHQVLILTYAFAVTGDMALAEDAHQEVALLLAERWSEVPGGEDGLRWLKGAVRRKSLELRRRMGPRPGQLSQAALDQVEAALPDAEESEIGDERAALLACVERLGATARRVLDLRYRERLDCGSIAQRLGRPVASIYTTIKRARQLLADCTARRVEGSA